MERTDNDTWDLATGVGATATMVAAGRARDVHPLMWGVSAFFAIYFAIEPLKHLFNIS